MADQAVHLAVQARTYDWFDQSAHQQGETTYSFYADGSFIGRKTLDGNTKRTLLRRLHNVTEEASVRGWSDESREELAKVGNMLFRFVIPDDARKAVFSSDGPAAVTLDVQDHDLPWELLHDGHGYIAQRVALARSLIRPARIPRTGTRTNIEIVVVGDPTEDLASARDEAESIARKCAAAIEMLTENLGMSGKVVLLCGQEATKEALLMDLLMEHDRPIEILHYAGHARFDPRSPDNSGLVLADGDLRGFEARAMGSCPLVFANGCRAGNPTDAHDQLTHGAVSGLAAEFLAGGAIGYIAPIWPVRDSVASAVADSFYESMIGGSTISESLLATKQKVTDTDALAYVFYGNLDERLAAFAPNLTGGPHVNDLGVRRIIEIEREYPKLEVLAVNDLPWILWDQTDIASWVSRLPIAAARRRSVAGMLADYIREFGDAILSGQKRFLCIVNSSTLRTYLERRGAPRLGSLKEALQPFLAQENFAMILADTGDPVIEEMEFVSRKPDLPLRVEDSIYVFNKQTGPEQSMLTYNLFEEYNTHMIAQYWQRFTALFDRAVLAYGIPNSPQPFSADAFAVLNRVTLEKLATLIDD